MFADLVETNISDTFNYHDARTQVALMAHQEHVPPTSWNDKSFYNSTCPASLLLLQVSIYAILQTVCSWQEHVAFDAVGCLAMTCDAVPTFTYPTEWLML